MLDTLASKNYNSKMSSTPIFEPIGSTERHTPIHTHVIRFFDVTSSMVWYSPRGISLRTYGLCHSFYCITLS